MQPAETLNAGNSMQDTRGERYGSETSIAAVSMLDGF